MPSDKYLCEKCKGMSDEEVQEATENIEQEKIDFQMDYVDFCNEFGYDANSRDSAKLYKYGRKIYNLDGVY
jgi:hypothetical protein